MIYDRFQIPTVTESVHSGSKEEKTIHVYTSIKWPWKTQIDWSAWSASILIELLEY